MNMDSTTDTGSGTAVSIFGQAQGMNDFPVLKAFQEYIDAEQTKARRRMLGLSIFFVVLLAIVVVTFTLIVLGVINRNQTLSDRLLELAMQKQQPQVVNPPPAAVPQPVQTPPVVVQQPVQTVQNVWVEGRYVDQPQANGTIVRTWVPGHYEQRSVVVQ